MASNEDNPYISLVGEMKRQGEASNPLPFLLGTVTSAQPLAVLANGVQYQREDLLIAHSLLLGDTQSVSITAAEVSGAVTTTEGTGSLNTFQMGSGTITSKAGLAVGERVILLVSEDRQTLVLICKVR